MRDICSIPFLKVGIFVVLNQYQLDTIFHPYMGSFSWWMKSMRLLMCSRSDVFAGSIQSRRFASGIARCPMIVCTPQLRWPLKGHPDVKWERDLAGQSIQSRNNDKKDAVGRKCTRNFISAHGILLTQNCGTLAPAGAPTAQTQPGLAISRHHEGRSAPSESPAVNAGVSELVCGPG